MNNIENIPNYKGYMGNPQLKKFGIGVKWTPDLISEWIKCSEDPIYFCETYMKIVNVDKGLIPFKLHDYQKEMIISMKDNRNTIIATARQVGKCFCINTPITIRNKKTGEIKTLSIGEFHERTKKMSKL
jgi:hypothetical protein